ncbi:porin [Shewanella submarina]|uniref:Porin n=1 Tax=Shewanella submarina TaxID=2016376 RepID=A0ABV7GNB5_9GAMM|nr:porin [Shewanella submarina]MCL1036294.1 porin [Shewanella submarina]
MMNTLTKTLIASAIATAMVSGAQAADAVTVYGKLNVTAQSNDEKGESKTEIQSNASRLGVKGAFDLGNNLEAFYTIEYEVDTGADTKDNFEARNQFVGLRGDFGSVAMGRNDTMLKKSQGKVDLFSDLDGDIKKLFKGENRLAQTATYMSPNFSNFTFGVTYVAEGDSDQDYTYTNGAGETILKETDGFSAAAMYGDAKLKKTPIFVSIAYDSEVKGYDVLRATAQGKIAGFKIGGMYQEQEESQNGKSKSGYMFSASYDIQAVTLKGQYQDMEDMGSSWSVGADYKLAKPTKLLAFYTSREYDNSSYDDEYIGVGIQHSF